MVSARGFVWLFVFLCLTAICTSETAWLARVTNVWFGSKRQEFLIGEKVRLEHALHEARQIASLLQEENTEIKNKVVTLKSNVQSLKKEIVLLRLEHMKEMGVLTKNHAKNTAELRESFKKFRSKEISSLTNKLEGKFETEKKDLAAALQASHTEEVNALKKSLRLAETAVSQNESKIRELKDKLSARDQEVAGFVERERLSASDKEKLIQEIETLTQGLRHIKLAEEARAMDNDGNAVTPTPPTPQAQTQAQAEADAAALVAQTPTPAVEPRPERPLTVPEGIAHSSGAPHELRVGDPVVVETSSRKQSRKVGGSRIRRAYQSAGNSNDNNAFNAH